MKSYLHRHPALKKIVLLILVVAGLFLARIVIGLGSGWMHYSNTPGFSTFIAEKPVEQETLEELFTGGKLLVENGDFFSGTVDPVDLVLGEGDYEKSSRVVEITLDHGSENLLQFSQEFHQTLDRKTWVRHGFGVGRPTIKSHPDLRVMSEARVFNLEEMFDPDEPGKGGVRIQVAVAAGPGKDRSLITEGEYQSGIRLDSPEFREQFNFASQQPSFPMWRRITGITHNLQDLPDEGWMHVFQLVVRFDRRKLEGGSQGPSSHFPQHATSTGEYSFSWKVEQKNSRDGKPSGSSSSSMELKRLWNGNVW